MKRIKLILLSLLVSIGLFGESVTFTSSDFSGTNTELSSTKDGINVVVSSGTSADEIRIFKGQTITVSSEDTITSIVFTCTKSGTTKYGPGCFGSLVGYSYEGNIGTWTGELLSVSFTASSNQVRCTSIVVTYKKTSSEEPDPIIKDTIPSIEIARWDTNAVYIDISNFDAVTASLENQNTQAVVKENVATELFFSKYFEAGGDNKMIAVYNGTKDTIDLSNYYIQNASYLSQKLQLSSFGKIPGYLCPGEELIFARFSSSNSAKDCAEKEEGFDEWISFTVGDKTGVPTGFHNTLTFGGRASLGLYKNDELIDVIGSHNEGSLIRIGKSGTAACTYAKIAGYNDDAGFYTYNGTNIETDTTNYFLSTNRCLLVRKNTVKSGENAVTNNVYATYDECSQAIAESFVTLSSEWTGLQIGNSSSTSDEVNTLTCSGLAYIGAYDYNKYYAQYDTIMNETELSSFIQPDSTYKIPINKLDTLSCTNLKIIVKDRDSKELSEVFKIPIFVSKDTLSNSVLFTKEGGDCKDCDVVVLSNATLTVSNEQVEGKTWNRNRDVKIYENGRLLIEDGNSYTVNSLSLRRTNDEISSAYIKGTLNILQENGFYFDLYTDGSDWRFISLPEDYNLSSLTLSSGKKTTFGEDYIIQIYDGAYRAVNKKNGWKEYNGVIKAGTGFIFAVNGNKKKEYRFKFSNDIISKEGNNKMITGLYAYGCNDEELKPNHKGWNLIGNSFLDYIETEVYNPIRESYLIPELDENGNWTGEWELVPNNKLRYGVFPSKNSEDKIAGGYKSVLLDDIELKPFTAFFIQVGGNPEEEQSITLRTEKRRSIVSRNAYEEEEVFLRIFVGEDKTGFFISDNFSEEFEPGDDLESRYSIYQEINGYKLLYSAISDSTLEKGVKTHSNGGYVKLDPKVKKNLFEEIWIKTDKWFDLLNEEEVFVEDNFTIYAKLKRDIPTDIETIRYNNVVVYDLTGKFVSNRLENLNSGLYIINDGNSYRKVFIRK